jgi:hypothetical protein
VLARLFLRKLLVEGKKMCSIFRLYFSVLYAFRVQTIIVTVVLFVQGQVQCHVVLVLWINESR